MNCAKWMLEAVLKLTSLSAVGEEFIRKREKLGR